MKNSLVSDEEMKMQKQNIQVVCFVIRKCATIASFARNIITQDLQRTIITHSFQILKRLLKTFKSFTEIFQTNKQEYLLRVRGAKYLKQKILYNGDKLTVRYFDNFGNETVRPDYSVSESVSATSIISNYIDAIGGLDKLNSVTSIEETYTADVMGNPFDLYTLKVIKNQSVTTISVMGQSQKIV